MDLTEYSMQARKRILSELPPKHEVDTLFVDQKFGGYRIGKKGFLSFEPVINIPIKKKDDKFTFEVETLNQKYAELALKIGKQLSEIS